MEMMGFRIKNQNSSKSIFLDSRTPRADCKKESPGKIPELLSHLTLAKIRTPDSGRLAQARERRASAKLGVRRNFYHTYCI